ncbi:MAG: carbohydrate ABC transporter permease [Thermoleophilia bacterium]
MSDTIHPEEGLAAKPAANPSGGVATGGPLGPSGPSRRRFASRFRGEHPSWKVAIFLLPGLFILGALVVYPILFTLVRSLYSSNGAQFVGIANYRDMFTSADTLIAIKNNVIWVVVAPAAATALGLVFAVLTERVPWATAFKVAVFVPMAISFLSSGVIWRLVYQDDPRLGLANAALVGISKVFQPPGPYPTARPSQPDLLVALDKAYVTAGDLEPGASAELGLVAVSPRLIPADAIQAATATPEATAITGTVWVDFAVGGTGAPGVIDPGELGLPGVKVEVLSDAGGVVGSATTGPDGTFAITGIDAGSYKVGLAESNFRPAWGGILWLGPALITPSIIISYIWIWAGFAMVLIGAGLAAIPRDVLEAARVDGAGEWQVFRRITGPLLAPLLLVVLVTLLINVLKIFDLILVIPPGSVLADANVIALEMWQVSFGGGQNQGLGSALAILLFVLVLPAMAFNLRRFRAEQ